jgi:acyl carrier protein
MFKQGLLLPISIGASGAGLGLGIRAIADGHYLIASVMFAIGLGGLAGFLSWAIQESLRRRRHWKEWQRRPRQSDAAFALACNLQSNAANIAVALQIRRVFAEVSGVPPETIHADDSSQDSIWDSIDLVEIEMRVEKSIKAEITEGWFDDAYRASGAGTKPLVRHIVNALIMHLASNASPVDCSDLSSSAPRQLVINDEE